MPVLDLAGGHRPATPSADDPSAVELGVKFRTSTAGFITGIRFYKGTGQHRDARRTALDRGGTQLATVTFTNESESGWQQA